MERDPIRWDSLLSILSPRSPLRSPLRFSPWFSIYLETPSQGRPPARDRDPETASLDSAYSIPFRLYLQTIRRGE